MRDRLFRKGFETGIIVLFISMSILSNGFSANAVSINKEINPGCEPCNTGCDIELVEIVPYSYGHHAFEFLHFGCKVKNVGYETCSPFGYKAYAYRIKDDKKVGELTCSVVGELKPGEEHIFDGRAGLVFDDFYFPPTLFRFNFTTRPNDPNKENNYAEARYLVWGGFMGPASYIRINGTIRDIKLRTVNIPFIERFPLLNLLLQRVRI